MSGTWPAKLIVASVLLIAPLYASVDEAAGQDLKDEVQRVIAPAPAGGGKPVSREYEDYLPDVVFFESAPPPPVGDERHVIFVSDLVRRKVLRSSAAQTTHQRGSAASS